MKNSNAKLVVNKIRLKSKKINSKRIKNQLVFCALLLFLVSFNAQAQAEAINDNGTNVGIGTTAPSSTQPNNNIRLYVNGGERTNDGTQTAQRFRSSQNYLGSSSASGYLGLNVRTNTQTSAYGVTGNISVSDASSLYDARPSENNGGKFLADISGISGTGKHFITGVTGILNGRWDGQNIDGYAAGTVGIDNINGASTYGGYFKGKLRSGDIINPSFSIFNDTGKYLEIGVSSCNGCFNGYTKPGDAVIRTLGGGDLIFAIPGTNGDRKIAFHSAGDKIMTIQEVGNSGKVGIGTAEFPTIVGSADVSDYKLFVDEGISTEEVRVSERIGVGTTDFPTTVGSVDVSDYKLFVEVGILTEEVRVRTGWADYVFNDNYKLTPLAKVEAFISENGHLPNVPSAKEVESSGLELGDITRIQQEKIEELTLYIIDQQKQINELKTLVHDLIERK